MTTSFGGATPPAWQVRCVTASDLPAVNQFYEEVCAAIATTPYGPAWQWGVNPSAAILQRDLNRGKLLLGYDHAQLAAVGVLLAGEDPDYQGAAWRLPATEAEIGVLHLFAVHPRFRGRGISTKMLRAILAQAHADGRTVLHLDAIKGNVPAEKLYLAAGFRFVEERIVTPPHIGRITLRLMERTTA